MKAISIIQPWASLVILGAKRFETRSWQTSHRGPLYVHASKKFPTTAQEICLLPPFSHHIPSPATLPVGSLVGVVEVVDCWPIEAIEGTGYSVGKKALDETELAFGDYRPGRWAWELRVLERFEKPAPIAGHLGLWDVPEGVVPITQAVHDAPARPPESLFPAAGYLEGR